LRFFQSRGNADQIERINKGLIARGLADQDAHDIKGAIEDINKSLKIYPENSYAYKIKALIYIEKKDFKTACENLELAQSKKYKQTYGNEVEELIAKYCE
jgi:Tfp pilus assembly protein PilF